MCNVKCSGNEINLSILDSGNSSLIKQSQLKVQAFFRALSSAVDGVCSVVSFVCV